MLTNIFNLSALEVVVKQNNHFEILMWYVKVLMCIETNIYLFRFSDLVVSPTFSSKQSSEYYMNVYIWRNKGFWEVLIFLVYFKKKEKEQRGKKYQQPL